MYDSEMVKPMREELVRAGFRELRTAKDVDEAVASTKGTLLIVVNSVCGCAAGSARPGVALAVEGPVRPTALATVFAGVDREATERARELFTGRPPSSPSMGLLKDGKLVWMLERHQIEGRGPGEIAKALGEAFAAHCGPAGASA